MRRFRAITCGCLLALVVILVHAQQPVSGKVINRNGKPQPDCQVFVGSMRSVTDAGGSFSIANPRYGTYVVVIKRGQQSQAFSNVAIDTAGLHPSVFVVNW